VAALHHANQVQALSALAAGYVFARQSQLELLAVAKKANLPVAVTAHTFRRSCTTELVRSGANLWRVKEFLGHENLDHLDPYVRLTITDLKRTHERCHPRERGGQ
jgi:site-specific recombinase XerD